MSEQQIAEQEAPVTNPSIRQLNESYAGKIAKGELEVTKQQNKSKLTPAQQYDKLIKRKKIAQAEREKRELEKKLEYLNRSIQAIKDYDFSTGKVTSKQIFSPPARVSPPKSLEQLKKKVKEFQKELNSKREAIRLKKYQKQEQHRKALLEQQQTRKAEKMQKILQNIQKINKRGEQRQQILKKRDEEYRRVVMQKSLHQKLEQSFTQKQATVLEQRKKKLADIRNLHRPISLAEIEDHQKTFMEVLKEKESMRQRQRKLSNVSEEYRVSYRSPTHLKITQGDKEERYDQSRIKADKMRQFSQHVRENFAPSIDEKKRESLQKVLGQQKQKRQRELTRRQQQAQRVQEIRSKGLRYLQQLKDVPKRKNPQAQPAPQSERIYYKNYLTHSQRASGRAWNCILSSSQDKKQKAIRLQAQAERLEGALKMREKKARLLKEDTGQIDQEYFDMIKAKLDLLQI